jgi:hypothetical protein
MALTQMVFRLKGLLFGILVLNVFVRLIVWMAYSFCSLKPPFQTDYLFLGKFMNSSVSVEAAIKHFYLSLSYIKTKRSRYLLGLWLEILIGALTSLSAVQENSKLINSKNSFLVEKAF